MSPALECLGHRLPTLASMKSGVKQDIPIAQCARLSKSVPLPGLQARFYNLILRKNTSRAMSIYTEMA